MNYMVTNYSFPGNNQVTIHFSLRTLSFCEARASRASHKISAQGSEVLEVLALVVVAVETKPGGWTRQIPVHGGRC